MAIHVTPIPSTIELAAPAFTLGTANTAGAAVTAVSSNSTLLTFDTTNPAAVANSPAVGSAVVASRRDHVHGGGAYEEGTFTPEIADNNLNGSGEGQVYNYRVGRYVRIGRIVTFELAVSISSLGTLTTSQQTNIVGLPVTSANISNMDAACTVGGCGSMAITAGYAVTARIVENASYIVALLFDSGTGTSNLLLSELSAGGSIRVSGTYEV